MRESERESERAKGWNPGYFTICRPDWVSWGIVMTCHAPRHVSWIQGLEIVMRLRHCLDNLKLLASGSTAISITTLRPSQSGYFCQLYSFLWGVLTTCVSTGLCNVTLNWCPHSSHALTGHSHIVEAACLLETISCNLRSKSNAESGNIGGIWTRQVSTGAASDWCEEVGGITGSC